MTKKAAGKIKVWRIFHYKERYHFDTSGHSNPERFQAGPPKFVKQFIGRGSDVETINFYKQKCTLKAHKLYDTLNTIYDELLELAAYQDENHRGYIVDGMQQPADVKTIASLLNRNINTVKKAIEILHNVGLIEQVSSAVYRQDIGRVSAKKRKPVKTRGSRTANDKRKRDRKNKSAKAEAEGKVKISQKERIKPKQSTKPKPNKKQRADGKGHQEAQSSSTSPMPKPIKPTESESDQGQEQITSAPPGHSVNFDRTAELLQPQAAPFAVAIYQALKVPWALESTKGQREYQSIAEAWNRAQRASLGIPGLQRLWDKSTKSATRIGNSTKRKPWGSRYWTKSPAAVWMSEFNKRLKAYQIDKVEVANTS
jgi:hypothetical protein